MHGVRVSPCSLFPFMQLSDGIQSAAMQHLRLSSELASSCAQSLLRTFKNMAQEGSNDSVVFREVDRADDDAASPHSSSVAPIVLRAGSAKDDPFVNSIFKAFAVFPAVPCHVPGSLASHRPVSLLHSLDPSMLHVLIASAAASVLEEQASKGAASGHITTLSMLGVAASGTRHLNLECAVPPLSLLVEARTSSTLLSVADRAPVDTDAKNLHPRAGPGLLPYPRPPPTPTSHSQSARLQRTQGIASLSTRHSLRAQNAAENGAELGLGFQRPHTTDECSNQAHRRASWSTSLHSSDFIEHATLAAPQTSPVFDSACVPSSPVQTAASGQMMQLPLLGHVAFPDGRSIPVVMGPDGAPRCKCYQRHQPRVRVLVLVPHCVCFRLPATQICWRSRLSADQLLYVGVRVAPCAHLSVSWVAC